MGEMAGQSLGALPSNQADWSGVGDAIARAPGFGASPRAQAPSDGPQQLSRAALASYVLVMFFILD